MCRSSEHHWEEESGERERERERERESGTKFVVATIAIQSPIHLRNHCLPSLNFTHEKFCGKWLQSSVMLPLNELLSYKTIER